MVIAATLHAVSALVSTILKPLNMSEPKNIKEFIALVKRYETITLEEIEEVAREVGDKSMYYIAKKCTGFASIYTCTLCIRVKLEMVHLQCFACVYQNWSGCSASPNLATYGAIEFSTDPAELLIAYRARAAHLRLTYPQYFDEQTS
jgi:hypothetical protein